MEKHRNIYQILLRILLILLVHYNNLVQKYRQTRKLYGTIIGEYTFLIHAETYFKYLVLRSHKISQQLCDCPIFNPFMTEAVII